MRSSKIAPWITIFAGLLWFFAAAMGKERNISPALAITIGIVFLLVGLAQLKVNRGRFKDEKNSSHDEKAG